ncbi:MAG: zinc ribbon domain-containing protein [Bacteroidota bacterium]
MNQEFTINFCPFCGTQRVPEANYCARCGTDLESVLNEPEENLKITIGEFFPRLVDALEDVSIANLLKTISTAKNILLYPFRYAVYLREGKLAPLFTILVMATFAGAFKLFLHPFTKPLMEKLDMGNDVGNAMLQFVLYVFLATFFGYLAVVVARIIHSVLKLRVERTRFVYAMVSVFSILSFAADVVSPFWIAAIENGSVTWWQTEITRASITTIYCFLTYQSLRREAVFLKENVAVLP